MAEQKQSSDRWIEAVKARHDFDSWYGTNALDENLFIWHYALRGDELAGWEVERIRRVELAGQVPALKSLWGHEGAERNGTVLSLEVFECGSRLEAHEILLGLLGQFESTLVTRETEGPVGDVCFSMPSETAVLFARANLVALVRNAGPDVVAVGDPARSLDADLVRRPAPDQVTIAPAAELEPMVPDLAVGQRTTLKATVGDLLGRTVTMRIWSRLGEVRMVDQTLTYEARRVGIEEITVLMTNDTGGVAVIGTELTLHS